MKWAYAEYGDHWTDAVDCELYGDLTEHEEGIRNRIKTHYSELKENRSKTCWIAKLGKAKNKSCSKPNNCNRPSAPHSTMT